VIECATWNEMRACLPICEELVNRRIDGHPGISGKYPVAESESMPRSSRAPPSRVFIPPARLPAMLFQDLRARLGKFTVPIQCILQYNVSNWIRENAPVFFSSPTDLRFDLRRQMLKTVCEMLWPMLREHNANSEIVGRSTI
jgi:hypothetical protein